MSQDTICPKCKENKLYPVGPRNALSRRDNKTHICSDCGIKEALEDLAGWQKDERQRSGGGNINN